MPMFTIYVEPYRLLAPKIAQQDAPSRSRSSCRKSFMAEVPVLFLTGTPWPVAGRWMMFEVPLGRWPTKHPVDTTWFVEDCHDSWTGNPSGREWKQELQNSKLQSLCSTRATFWFEEWTRDFIPGFLVVSAMVIALEQPHGRRKIAS